MGDIHIKKISYKKSFTELTGWLTKNATTSFGSRFVLSCEFCFADFIVLDHQEFRGGPPNFGDFFKILAGLEKGLPFWKKRLKLGLQRDGQLGEKANLQTLS